MAHAAYRARTLRGDVVEGHIRAKGEQEARMALSRKGLELLAFEEQVNAPEPATGEPLFQRFTRPIKSRTLRALTGQLAIMLETGTPLIDSLDALADQASDERVHTILQSASSEVRGGSTFSAALEGHPRAFNRLYVSAVKAGEASGNLTTVFNRLETHMMKRENLIAGIWAAMIYPILLTLLAICAVIFLVTFVLPKFTAVFERSGVLLPIPTRMLLAIVSTGKSHWVLLLVAAIAVPAALFAFLRSERGKPLFDRFSLAVPVVSPLVIATQSSGLLRTLGTLLDAGVPLVEAIAVAEEACSNSVFRQAIGRISASVLRGEGFSAAFSASPLFDAPTKQMVATAEETGTMAMVMTRVADHLDESIDKQMKKLSAFVEPLVIVIMGLMVGFIAIAVLLPLFRLTSAVR